MGTERIHASAVIGDGVELGERVAIGPGAVLLGPLTVGDDCWIGPGVVLGTPPEITSAPHNSDWTSAQQQSGVVIGARTVIRELSTVHQGSYRPTTIGADSWLLNRVYVAHDCQLGDHVTLSAGVSLGGHILVGAGVNVGMNAVVHQRRVIAPGAMVGMGTVVTKDIPPYSLVYGNPVRLHGVNKVGMSRAGIEDSVIERLAAEYSDGRLPEDLPESVFEAFSWWKASEPARPLTR
jgi:UDP-N-acetylglucosamine acyltransferase